MSRLETGCASLGVSLLWKKLRSLFGVCQKDREDHVLQGQNMILKRPLAYNKGLRSIIPKVRDQGLENVVE